MNNMNDTKYPNYICPSCFNGSLIMESDSYLCPNCSKKYPIISGIPVLLPKISQEIFLGKEFQEKSDEYDENHDLVDNDFNVIKFFEPLEKIIGKPMKKVEALEIGAGTGYLSSTIIKHVYFNSLIATDLSIKMLLELQKKLKSFPLHYTLCSCDANYLPFENSQFDVVYGGSVLHHVYDLPKSLREIHRVLKNGGVACFQEPFADGYRFICFLFQLIQITDQYRPIYRRKISKSDKTKLNIFCDNIFYRYYNRKNLKGFENIDDKHLFVEEEFISLAIKMGFRDVKYGTPFCTQRKTEDNIESVWRGTIIENLKGLELNPTIISAYEPIFVLLDRICGDSLIDRISPVRFIYLIK